MTLRATEGASARSCSSAESVPWSGSTRTPAGVPISACARRISGAPGRKQRTCPPALSSDGSHGPGQGHARLVPHLDRVRTARHVDHRAVVQEGRHRPGVERRRHDQDPQVVARPPRLPGEGQREVGVKAALVELVEHDRAEAAQQGIRLEASGEDPLGRHQEARVLPEATLEAHLPADFPAERPALLLGDPARDRASRDPARLEQEDGAVGDERRRHPRRLPRARWRDEHRRARPGEGVTHSADMGVDRERRWHWLMLSRPRTGPLSSRGTSAGRVPRDPRSQRRRIPRRPARSRLLGMTSGTRGPRRA